MTAQVGDMPALFESADSASLAGQRWYLRGIRVRLALLLGASACGLAALPLPGSPSVDGLALLAVLFFVLTLMVDVALWRDHPERRWYDGRALAESVKPLTWKYAVGGEPFPVEMPSAEARTKFLELLEELRSRFKVQLEPTTSDFIPTWVTDTRNLTLEARSSAYMEKRLSDQQRWYTSKSIATKKHARVLRSATITLEGGGIVAALVSAISDLPGGVAGLLATGVAAIGVWLATRQFDFNAAAYATASLDLGAAKTKLLAATIEEDWAREMNDAEDAISREHTLWLASRSH